MAISIAPYTADWILAVKAFNQRLAAGGVGAEFRFPESNIPHWLPEIDDRTIYQRYYLAVDGEQVRGAFILKHQEFRLRQGSAKIVYYHLPLSEGIVNKSYSSVGVLMLRSALKVEPSLYCLGMGGFDRPLPTMLKALRWSMCAVPFYFRVVRPSRFLREVQPVRRTPLRRLLADAGAFSGLGWLAIHALQTVRSRRPFADATTEPIVNFGDWADALWVRGAPQYPLIASRESRVLNVLYPSGKNFLCYKVSRGNDLIGWFVALDTQMKDNKYFGNLRIGAIADCLATPENARSVIEAARTVLTERGVDLVVANHSHQEWGSAFTSAGFFEGPSNFIFAASRHLSDRLGPFPEVQHQVYLMRGDGDGPVNL